MARRRPLAQSTSDGLPMSSLLICLTQWPRQRLQATVPSLREIARQSQRLPQSGSGWESNPPNVGIRRSAGFEDRDGHQSRIHSRKQARSYRLQSKVQIDFKIGSLRLEESTSRYREVCE